MSTFDDVTVAVQKVWNANRTLGWKRLVATLAKYFSVDDPFTFQTQLRNKKRQFENFFEDQKFVLFGDINGTYVRNMNFTLLMKILRLTNDPLWPYFEELHEIRKEICYASLGTFLKKEFKMKFDKQKMLLLKVGAKDKDVEYWRTASADVLAVEYVQMYQDLINEMEEFDRSNTIFFAREPSSDLLLHDSLEIVCNLIGDKWNALCKGLAIDKNTREKIETKCTTHKEKMASGFEYLYNNISWSTLKKQLKKIEKEDIIEKIIKETCITTGLQQLSDALYKHWEDEFSRSENNDFFTNDKASSQFLPFEDVHVNLVVSEKMKVDKHRTLTDHEFNLRFCALKYIELKDVLTERERIVLVRGISGVGKTFLVKQIGLQWSKENLITYIKCLYVLRCREIANLEHASLIALIRSEYQELLKNISDKEMIDIAGKTAILIDGFDELSIDDRLKLSELINNSKDKFHLLITSRPYPMTFLYKKIKEKSPKIVGVLGFTEENKKLFVDNFYRGNPQKAEKISSLGRNLLRNTEMNAFASIPAYLYTLCCLNHHIVEADFPDTKTGLFLLATLVTVQKNNKKLKLCNDHIMDACENEVMLKIMYLLARASHFSLERGEHIIPANEIGHDADLLIHSGMLFKCRTVNGDAYQFRHLIFAEVLAGLYLFLLREKGIQMFLKLDESSQLWNALPTVISLHSLVERQEGNVVLRKLVNCFCKYERCLQTDAKRPYPDSLLESDEMVEVVNKVIDTSYDFWGLFKPHPSLLLETIYEHVATPPHFFYDIYEEVDFLRVNIYYHYSVKYISKLFLLLDEKKTSDSSLEISMEDEIIADDEIDMLKHVFGRFQSITLYSKINVEFFIRQVTKPDGTFINLERLSLMAKDIQKESAIFLMSFVPRLKYFCINLKDNLTQAVETLSKSIIQETDNDNLTLIELWITNANEKQIDAIMPCVPCLEEVYIYGDDVKNTASFSSRNVGHNESISESTTKPMTSTCMRLTFRNCHVSREALDIIQQTLKHLHHLEITSSDQTSEFIFIIKEEIVNQRAEELKSLCFSDLDEDDLDEILTFIDHLSELQIYKTDISMEWLIEVRSSKTPLHLILDFGLQGFNFDLYPDLSQSFEDSLVKLDFGFLQE